MKGYFLLILPLFFLALGTKAQGDGYNLMMNRGISILDTAKQASDFAEAASAFGQSSRLRKKEWLPTYYVAMCEILTAFEKKGKDIDSWCDKAERHIAKADSLSGNNSEIMVLRSMLASARIQVNSGARGQKYGGQAYKLAEEAIKLDASNPRAYLQKATAIYYTPASVGGGAKKAKPVFEQALEKYKAYKAPSTHHPHWGKDRAEKMLREISK